MTAQAQRHGTGKQFALFLLMGLVNTAFGYAVYALLVWLGLAPRVALALSFAIGVVWNYFTHARIVFQQRGFDRLLPYVGAYVLILGINTVLLEGLLRLGVGPYAAQALLAPVSAALSFMLLSKVLTGRFPFRR